MRHPLFIVPLLFAVSLLMGACTFNDNALQKVERCEPGGEPCSEGFCNAEGYCQSEPPADFTVMPDVVSDAMTDMEPDLVIPGCGGDEPCPPGLVCCNDQCIDTQSSNSHCGMCGATCGENQECFAGVCVCDVGFQDCDQDNETGCEVNLQTDNTNCGVCGETCLDDAMCGDGLCLCDGNLCDDAENCCGTGDGNSCVNTMTSPEHCGACGDSCRPGEVCDQGECKCAFFDGSLADGCGMDEACCDGACIPSQEQCTCGDPIDQIICGDQELCCADVCVNTRTDVNNCSACGIECPMTFECQEGTCRCPEGENNCDGTCVNRLMDAVNCGTCGNDCTDDQNIDNATCAAGMCEYECSMGWDECDGMAGNGCDTDLSSSAAHCGACNNDCGSLPGVDMVNCNMGACEIVSCAAGFEDCDGDPMNGCEAAGCRVTSDLIAYWPFTDGSGTTVADLSGFGSPMDLSWSGGGVSWIQGRNGVSTDGTRIDNTDPAKLFEEIATGTNATDEFTVEAWIKPANLTATGPARIVTLSYDQSYRSFTLGQQQDDAIVRLRVDDGDTNNNGTEGGSNPISVQVMETNEMHLVFTYNNGDLILYKNGTEVDSNNIGGSDLDNWYTGHDFALANEFRDPRPWPGEIYLVAIYRRALTPAEITDNYDAGSFVAP